MLRGDVACGITVGYDKYWMVRLAAKAAFSIVDVDGDVVAEVSFDFLISSYLYQISFALKFSTQILP